MEMKTESLPPDQITKTSLPSPPSHSPTDLPSTPTASENFSNNFAALYHSIFPPKSPPPLPISLSLTPSTASSYSSEERLTTESRLRQASLILEFQELYDHYEVSLARLRSLSDELASLRAENADLRIANSELLRLLTLPSRIGPTKTVVESNRRNNNNNDVFDEERITLPKSISVRSRGYLKVNRQGNASESNSADSLPRLASRLNQLVPMQHRVYVPAVGAGCGGGSGGNNGGESAAVEFEVYNQGMRKTELCNKWQETGTCPYGDHCQFAHGIIELRPVIRHPRYKTQVCRMVLAGDICPYGHRCHFRHSLNDQERLLLPR